MFSCLAYARLEADVQWGIVTVLLVVVLRTTCFAATPEFVVGVEDNDYLPNHFINDGEYKGGFREILDAFAADKKYKFIYKPLPLNRLLLSFLDGSVDLKFPDNPYWAADVKKGSSITYSVPVCSYIDGVFIRPGDFGKGTRGFHKLGVVRGFTPITWMDKIQDKSVGVTEAATVESVLQLVRSERVDGAYLSVSVGLYSLNSMSDSAGLVYDPSLPHTKSSYQLSTIKFGSVIGEFDVWMEQHSQLISEIKEKHGLERGVQ